MKAIILTEGGKIFGFGHMTRCRALQQALSLQGIQTALVIRGNTAVCGQFCGREDHVFNWLIQKDRLTSLLRGATIAIIDSYHAPLSFYKKIVKIVPASVYIDDYMRLSYPKGMVVSGAIGAESFPYPPKTGIRYLAGAKYILLRKEYWNLPRKKTRPAIKDVLIATGGSNQSDFIMKLLSTVVPSFPQITFHVITAKKSALPKTRNIHFSAVLGAKKMRELMLKCDVSISGGGQTTNELAACGIPTIGICFADNQMLNIRGWQAKGFLKSVGSSDHPEVFKKISDVLKKMTYNQRRAMSAVGNELVDGQGARRVADAIVRARNLSHG